MIKVKDSGDKSLPLNACVLAGVGMKILIYFA